MSLGAPMWKLVATVLFAVLLASPVAAWHWEEEQSAEPRGPLAGDARVIEDALGCVEATRDVAGVDCVVLYAHVLELGGSIPLGVQRPPECAADLASGMTGTPGVEPHWTYSRRAARPAPMLVSEQELCPSGNFAPFDLHWPFGIGRAVRISPVHPLVGIWTLSADTLEFRPAALDAEPSFGAMPCVTVRMVLETGRFAQEGRVVAAGRTTKTIVCTPDFLAPVDLPVDDLCPGSSGVVRAEEATEFRVDLGRVADVLDPEEGFLLRIEWYQWDGGDPDAPDNVVQRDWNVRTGPKYLPRLILPVEDAILIENVTVRMSREETWIGVAFASPWGNHDVDRTNARLEIYDADDKLVLRDREPLLYFVQCNDCEHRAENISFRLDEHAAKLAPGDYTLKIMAPNWQHTAVAEWRALLRVTPDGVSILDEEGSLLFHLETVHAVTAPAPVLGFVVLVVALLLPARRMHRHLARRTAAA
jgi:hypothetical protein